MDVHLITASDADLPQLLTWLSAFHADFAIQQTKAQQRESLLTLIRNPQLGSIWLIHANEEAVGYIALCTGYSLEFGGLDAFIDEIYIAPDRRGSGIASQVLQLVKLEAKAMGIRALHLEVNCSDEKVQKLYQKSGFTMREKYRLMTIELMDQRNI